MSTNIDDAKIRRFIQTYVASKKGEIKKQPQDVFTITFPDASSQEYTYQPAVSREKKIPLIAPGSPAFRQILHECLENVAPSQILLNPKGNFEASLKTYFKDSSFDCEDCHKIALGEETVSVCIKPQPCFHRINNGQIVSVWIVKEEPVRFFQFYFSVVFQNKLRPKSEEIITVLVDEKAGVVSVGNPEESLFKTEAVEIQDVMARLRNVDFDGLKAAADEKLAVLLRQKLALFDLPLLKEKKAKLQSFDKRLRRERREQVISKRTDFDYLKWQANYEALMRREEESYVTSIAVKLINLLVINTSRVKFEATLDNGAVIHASTVFGFNQAPEVACPLCKKTFTEGYATQDGLYVCGNCVRQSIDSGKFYSKKAALTLDETLNEYFEQGAGFVCSVCGKRHSRLLEFKCSHDGSSVCIQHYGFCDVCGSGKIYSKANLSYTDEFKHQLCPKHAANGKTKEQQK